MRSSNNSRNNFSAVSFSAVKTILDKNNEGVDLIGNGRYCDAKKSLKSALVYLALYHQQQKRQEEKDSDEDFFEENDDFCCNDEEDALISEQGLAIEPYALPDSLDPTSYSHTLFMYRNAMKARLNREEQRLTKEVASCLVAVVTYNISICAHCKADSDNDNNQSTPRTSNMRVLKSYRRAWEALQMDAGVTEGMRKSYRDTMVLAILNNMGALFHQLSNFKKSKYCFRSLKNIINSDSITVKTELPHEIREGMMMNVYYVDERLDSAAIL